MTRFFSSKTYGHDRGLSAAFRQWRADSHCKFVHGYSLEFEFVFGADKLDDNNWVVDFGGLKDLEAWLRLNFDHKTLVAFDDPQISVFEEMHDIEAIDMVTVEATGCEMFAKMAMEYASELIQKIYGERCWVESVTVREHGANSAICKRTS
ncbi:MAG: 6-pyruvoyl tetrahydrobiopterin synthase [Euryarchaeota archaeon]|nr:6-pyruvoyl tetrahydrobiopterin synthase [Euryarchaeota archaeon]|tara:strand:- start:176 stop:628 length:453 start_codon:yes stop_codon:yes gene_type:complete